MKWTCDRHAIWLNKTELRGTRMSRSNDGNERAPLAGGPLD